MGQAIMHNLKTIPPYFEQVRFGIKTFELRKDDREFCVDDLLHLMEYKDNAFTGEAVTVEITHILRDAPQFGLMPGYCIISFKKI